MNLLIDAGNSSLKWCIQDTENLSEINTCIYNKNQLGVDLENKWKNLSIPDQVLVSNVSGQSVIEIISSACKKLWDIKPLFLQVSKEACGVKNCYKDYRKLGIDRWSAVVAMWNIFKKGACIVDCGTTITIDGLSPDGDYLGGLIMPGITLMQKMLVENTNALEYIKNTSAVNYFADNTEQGQYSGCVLSSASLIEKMFGIMNTEYDNNIIGVITGGDSQIINSMLNVNFIHEPNLVLKGLPYLIQDIK